MVGCNTYLRHHGVVVGAVDDLDRARIYGNPADLRLIALHDYILTAYAETDG
jgi:hypothetical protein